MEKEDLESALEESGVLACNSMLSEIAALARKALQQRCALEEAQAAVKAAQAALDLTISEELPDAMATAGLAEFLTDDGTRISVRSNVYATISEAKKAAAFAWLREHGFGDLVKGQAILTLPNMSTEEHAALDATLSAVCQRYGIGEAEAKETVHPQTLKAFVKEQFSREDFPAELFNVFTRREAVIKQVR